MPTSLNGSAQRRHDLDWLRIAALGLLILTHTGYVYQTMSWRTQSEHAGLWGDLLIEAMAPWRISVVFFIAGAASRFMLDKHDLGGFVQNRVLRLLVPFGVAVIALVPTMLYIAEPQLRGANYLDFLANSGLRSHEVYSIWLPDLGHVWFLPYVFLYALIAGLAWFRARRSFEAVQAWINTRPVAVIVAGAALMLIISDAVFKPVFGRTNMLIDDPAGHVRSIPMFFLGLMLARPSGFWTRLRSAGVWLFPAVAVLFAVAMALATLQTQLPAFPGIRQLTGLADGAATVFAILSLASRFLARPGPSLSYLGDAIMPIYLMHQPVIVFVGDSLNGAGLPLWAEFGLIFGLAVGFPLFVYHFVVRQSSILRVLCGLKPHPPHALPAPAAS
jgi:peptidoglycan/LPS O-acetylase OafA/YrhL